MAGRYNFTIKQGTVVDIPIIWKDSAGTPVNVTGKTATLTAKVRKSDATPVMALTQADGLTVGTTDGKITIGRTAVQTAALTFKYASYDLFVGEYHLMSGEITIDKKR